VQKIRPRAKKFLVFAFFIGDLRFSNFLVWLLWNPGKSCMQLFDVCGVDQLIESLKKFDEKNLKIHTLACTTKRFTLV
jgi:hypothetical protein